MRTLVIVPARGGSRGLPHKNLREVGGVSLVGLAVRCGREALRRLSLEGRVLVDTDSDAIAGEAKRHGGWVPFLRPLELAADATPMVDNVLHACRRLAATEWLPELLLLLQPTSPLREVEHVVACLRAGLEGGGRSVVSVVEQDHPAEQTLRLASDSAMVWAWPDLRPESRRQDLPTGYRPSGAAYVTTVALLEAHRSFFLPGRTIGVVMRREDAIDIDVEADLILAQSLASQRSVTPVQIGNRVVGPGRPCFIIAEAGVNHDGDVRRAHELVDIAAEAGADAVKFQTFEPEKLAAPSAAMADYQVANTGRTESQADLLRRLVLPKDAHRELQRHADDRGLVFLSTPFDEVSADFLEELGVPAFKIGSGELTNHPLLAHVAAKGRSMLLSTGMADLAEVLEAVEIVSRAGAPGVGVFHCVTSYPASPSDANLRAMDTLRGALRVPVGWSDHTLGIAVSLAAVARGADILEKHFTIDPSLPGPDHKASLSPGELASLVRAAREIELSLGDGRKQARPAEIPQIRAARRSLHAARELPAGHLIAPGDLVALRPGDGLSPALLDSLAGRATVRLVPAGTKLSEDDLA